MGSGEAATISTVGRGRGDRGEQGLPNLTFLLLPLDPGRRRSFVGNASTIPLDPALPPFVRPFVLPIIRCVCVRFLLLLCMKEEEGDDGQSCMHACREERRGRRKRAARWRVGERERERERGHHECIQYVRTTYSNAASWV